MNLDRPETLAQVAARVGIDVEDLFAANRELVLDHLARHTPLPVGTTLEVPGEAKDKPAA